MAYCPKCNSPVPEGSAFCTNCGARMPEPQNNDQYYNPNMAQQYNYQNYNMPPVEPQPPVEEKANVGLAILSFLFPIVGLIIFATQKNKKPKTAKVSGICALVSFILGILFSVISSVAGALLATNGVADDLIDDINSIVDDGDFSFDDDYEIYDELFEVGTVENNVYTNYFTNLKFVTPDDNWSFAAYDDLLSSNPDASVDTETGSVVINTAVEKTYFDAIAVDNTTGANIQFLIVKATDDSVTEMSAEDYLEATVESVIGDNDATVSEYADYVDIGIDSYVKKDITYVSNGANVTQSMLINKMGNYYSCIFITFSPDVEDRNAEDFAAMIKSAV